MKSKVLGGHCLSEGATFTPALSQYRRYSKCDSACLAVNGTSDDESSFCRPKIPMMVWMISLLRECWWFFLKMLSHPGSTGFNAVLDLCSPPRGAWVCNIFFDQILSFPVFYSI